MNDHNSITITDVARAAGVSVSTVSRILNEKPDVAEATRLRVLKVIDELGYAPNVQAQSLAAGTSRTIALLYPPEYSGLTHNELDFFIGAAASASEKGYFFNLVPDPLTEDELLGLYTGGHIDGAIIMQIMMDDWRVNLLQQHNFPFTIIGRCADNTGISFIDFDFEQAVNVAFDHLIELGHRNIGFLARDASEKDCGYGPTVRCWAGYERACQRHTLAAVYRQINLHSLDAYEATIDMVSEQPDLTALVVVEARPVEGIVRALNDHGRAVPADFSIVAIAPNKVARLVTPPVTAVEFPAQMFGKAAALMLIRQLRNPTHTVEQQLPEPELIIRETTAPIRD